MGEAKRKDRAAGFGDKALTSKDDMILSRIASRLGLAGKMYRGKSGMRAYAVGDVHGCIAPLRAMLDLVEEDMRGFTGTAYLVMLGDLIDRGPASRDVIELLAHYRPAGLRPVFLMGNHEEFMLRALRGDVQSLRRWLEHGGAECVRSYGLDPDRLLAMDDKAVDALKDAVPPEHVDFIAGFGDTFAFGDYMFVHAGIRPGLSMQRQEHADLRWIREPFLDHRGDHGFMVVHGHTVTDAVDERHNRIGIDTGAYRGGPLTALVVEGATRRYLSTAGQSRGVLA